MSDSAFISWVESINAFTPNSLAERKLKLAVLCHPIVYFPVEESMMDFVGKELAIEAATSFEVVRSVLRSVYEIDGIDPEQNILSVCCSADPPYTWDKRKDIARGLKGAVYRSVARSHDISVTTLRKNIRRTYPDNYGWLRETAYAAVAATGTANAWRQINQVNPCSLICFDEATAFAAKRRIFGRISRATEAQLEELTIAIPSLEKIEWEHVYELRKNPYISNFRDWINGNANPRRADEVQQGLWSAFSDIVPKKKSTILKGIASNIPMPIPINPASLAIAANDVRNVANFQKQHGVSIFLHDLWNLTSKRSD